MTEPNKTDSQQQIIQNKVTIDIQILKKKQQLLISYYELQTEPEIIELLKSWPNNIIQAILNKDTILHKTNNAKFIGEICNEMFHGYGLLIYDEPKGRFYEGEFQNNCKHGDGVEYIGGDTYIGKFINNKPEDTNGVFMWKNGDLFIGGFMNGMKHGNGRWESGQDFYVGTWKYNKPEGNGTIHTLQSQYVGDIKSGYKHGRGIQIFLNGDSYEGLYANGKPEGDGTYKWKNGAIYKGQFKNGIRYGYGEWSLGKQRYEGQYVNDRRNGQGIYKWGNQSYYKGQFVEDKRHGIGQMHWNQKSFYRGEWKEGIQSGEGQIWEDGKLVSKGTFQSGKIVKYQRTPQIKLPNSRYQKHQKYDTNQVSSKKSYPSSQNKFLQMQKRKKLRSSSYYTNLSQIDQNNHSIKIKKHEATTSFSQNSHNTTKNKKSIKVNNKTKHQSKFQLTKKPIKQTVYLPQHTKRKISTNKLSKDKNQFGKDETVTPAGIVELSETQLGPIKWKNFRHMNHARNSDTYNLPHI